MLKLTKRVEGDTEVIELNGAIDGGDSCRRIHEAIREGLDQKRRKFVLVLREIEWVNSLGVGFLVAACVAAAREDAVVRLVGLSPRVGAVLRACGVVPRVWKDFESEELALESLE